MYSKSLSSGRASRNRLKLVFVIIIYIILSGCAMPTISDVEEHPGEPSTEQQSVHNTENEEPLDGSSAQQLPIHNILIDASAQQLPVRNNRLAAGGSHVLFVADDNSLWAWGNNGQGQLGNGTNEDQLHPVKIMDDVVFVNANWGSSMAIQSDGTLWACAQLFLSVPSKPLDLIGYSRL